MSIIILDLDNTIANDGWRIPRVNWQKTNPMERYHDYHMLAAFDEAGNKDLFLNTEHEIVILTARPVLYAPATIEWIGRQGIKPLAVIMRNNDDHCHSKDLKRKQLGWQLSLYGVQQEAIVGCYDDRPDVVAMYQEHGLHAEVRSIHNVCAYTVPQNSHPSPEQMQ